MPVAAFLADFVAFFFTPVTCQGRRRESLLHSQNHKNNARRMKTYPTIICLLILLVTLVCCKKEKEEQPQPASTDSFTQTIKSGGVPEPVAEKKEVKDSVVQQETRTDGSIWRCVSKKYSVEEANTEF